MRFEDLECCQASRQLVRDIYELTKADPFRKDFELVRQSRKSAISSMANIAEGFHRYSDRDFMRFLGYSRSSIAETLSHLYVALDQGYIEDAQLSSFKKQSDVTWKKINNLISYLKSSI
jgi:four helix bundle protein